MKKTINIVHGTALVAHIAGIVITVCNGKYIAAIWCAAAALWLVLNWINRLYVDTLEILRLALRAKYDALLKSKTAATITAPTPSKDEKNARTTKPLITLPCTARELETALHANCDHDGLWDAKIGFCGIDREKGPSSVGLCLMAEFEVKPQPLCERGATDDEVSDGDADWCYPCDNWRCPQHGRDHLVVCKHFHTNKGETA